MERILLVPAAGVGSRLGAGLPKVLVPVNGRPMIDHLLELYARYVDWVTVVVHPAAVLAVRERLGPSGDVVVQPEPTGMLDAIMLARPAVESHAPRRVLITWCDQVAIHPGTVARVASGTRPPANPALVVPTCRRADPYIHLERNAEGSIVGVLQRREGDAMPPVGESDVGVFDLSRQAFLEELPEFARAAAVGGGTGERNFLPFIPWMAGRAGVTTFPCLDPEEAIGINTPAELVRVEQYLRGRRVANRLPG